MVRESLAQIAHKKSLPEAELITPCIRMDYRFAGIDESRKHDKVSILVG